MLDDLQEWTKIPFLREFMTFVHCVLVRKHFQIHIYLVSLGYLMSSYRMNLNLCDVGGGE